MSDRNDLEALAIEKFAVGQPVAAPRTSGWCAAKASIPTT